MKINLVIDVSGDLSLGEAEEAIIDALAEAELPMDVVSTTLVPTPPEESHFADTSE